MYNLKLLVLSLLVLTKSSRSFAPIPVREVTFKFPLTDHSSTFLRLKSDDLLEEDAKLSPAQQQRGLDDDVTTVVAESTKNYDNRKEEECAIPSYNDCDPEGGYKSLVEEIAESIDVARETARLDGLSAYIVVSGLTCASSLSVCLGFIGFSHTTLEATILDCITVLSASLSGITGIYSTVVFSLCVCVSRPMCQSFAHSMFCLRVRYNASSFSHRVFHLCYTLPNDDDDDDTCYSMVVPLLGRIMIKGTMPL